MHVGTSLTPTRWETNNRRDYLFKLCDQQRWTNVEFIDYVLSLRNGSIRVVPRMIRLYIQSQVTPIGPDPG